MTELTAAALVGALASSLQQFQDGIFKMLRAMITGFSLAYFAGEDVTNFIQQYLSFQISQGGTIFLVAFFGTEALEKVILIARSIRLNQKWSNE